MRLKTCCHHDRNDNNNEITITHFIFVYHFYFSLLCHIWRQKSVSLPLSPLPSATTASPSLPWVRVYPVSMTRYQGTITLYYRAKGRDLCGLPNEVSPLKKSFLPLVRRNWKQGGTLFLAWKKATVTFWDGPHGWEWRAASNGWERPS